MSRISFALAAAVLGAPAATALPITAQSPIDIRSSYTRFTPDLPPLGFEYAADAALTLVNTGSPDEVATVRADVAPGAGALTIGGTRFDLLQFHFHTVGEHAINGDRAEMELHQVHRSADGTLAVVARLIEFGPENTLLAPLLANLPDERGGTFTIASFDLAALAPVDRRSFRHGGSLTTPPFTGGVLWNVIAEPLFLSTTQVGAFRELFPEGNARGLQPFFGTVLTDVEGFAVPVPASFALFGLGVAGLATARRDRLARG